MRSCRAMGWWSRCPGGGWRWLRGGGGWGWRGGGGGGGVGPGFTRLWREGLVESMPGRGLAVAPRRVGMGLTRAERMRRIDPLITQLMHEAVALELTPEEVRDVLEDKWKALAGVEKKSGAGGGEKVSG